MQTEYQINRCTRRCAVLDRLLQPGETYYSVVTESDDSWQRRDISAEAWSGPPEGAVGWWKNVMPARENRALKLAPDEVLLELLRQPPEHPAQTAIRYLLALLLLRKRVIKPAEKIPLTDAGGDGRSDDPFAAAMILEDPDDGALIEIEPWDATTEGTVQAQAALVELVYCEAE